MNYKNLLALLAFSASAAFGMQQADSKLIKELATSTSVEQAANNFKAVARTNKALNKFVNKNADLITQELSKNFNISDDQAYNQLWKRSALEQLPTEVKELIIASLVNNPDPKDPITLKKSRENLVNLLSTCRSFRQFNTPANLKMTLNRIAQRYTENNVLAAALVMSIPGSRPHLAKKATEEFQLARAYAGKAILLHCNDFQKALTFLKKCEFYEKQLDPKNPTPGNTIGNLSRQYILKIYYEGLGGYPYKVSDSWPPKEFTTKNLLSLLSHPNPHVSAMAEVFLTPQF